MNIQTIEVYNEQARIYDQVTADFWEKFPQQLIKHYAQKVKNGLVLNIGCGPSRDGLLLKQAGLNVVGLDASSSMTSITKERGFTAIQADALYLPFMDKTFKGIWAYTSLIHLPQFDLIPALMDLRRIIREDGVLAIGYINGSRKGPRTTIFSDGNEMLFNDYSMPEIDNFLAETGFWTFHSTNYKPNKTEYGLIMARPNLKC